MIVAALAAAARSMDLPPHGYQVAETPWAITITPEGDTVSLVPLRVERDGKTFALRQPVPRMTRTSGIAPQLACDTGVYALGMAKPPKEADAEYRPWEVSDRDASCHRAWTTLVEDWAADDPASIEATAIRTWLRRGKPGLADIVPNDRKDLVELATRNVVYFVAGKARPVHMTDSAVAFWRRRVTSGKSTRTGMCSSCGIVDDLVDTFPSAVPARCSPGSPQTSGVALTSANFATASRQLAVSQLRSAPICLTCSLNSVAALTLLADDPEHRWRGEDSITVWWLRGGGGAPILNWLDQPPAPVEVRAVFDQAASGARSPFRGDPDEHYYAMTYSGRGPRLVIRTWVSGTLRETQQRILDFLDDTAIAPSAASGSPWQPLWLLAKSAGSRRARGGRVVTEAPVGAHQGLIAAALTGAAPPANLLPLTLQRSRAEIRLARGTAVERRDWRGREHARASLVRLALTRNPQPNEGRTVPGPELDPDNPDPAYLCGRLFAEYESLQRRALGKDVNATITDRTYSKAMTSPLQVFPFLDRLAKAHLRKLRTSDRQGDAAAGAAIERRITELAAGIRAFPPALDVAGQGMWMLGYHQQRAHNILAAASARGGSGADQAPTTTDRPNQEETRSL